MNFDEPESGPICPVCGGADLREANGRALARCHGCGAYERTRLMWLVLEQLLPRSARLDVLHFAPEKGLARRLHEVAGGGYRALDFAPAGFNLGFAQVERFDLCRDAGALAPGSVDLVVHSHVLEHVPCAVGPVVHRLNAALRPGGHHVFCVPVIGTHYAADLDPALAPEQRRIRFGQEDHVRRFGRSDVRQMMADLFGTDVHFSQLASIAPARVRAAGLPSGVLADVSSHTVFAWRKPPVVQA